MVVLSMESSSLLFAVCLFGLILLPLGESVIWSPSLAIHGTTRNGLIRDYFRSGYTYSMMVKILWLVHGIRLSLRHLKRVVKALGMQRRVRLTGAVFRQVLTAIRVSVTGHMMVWHHTDFHGIICFRWKYYTRGSNYATGHCGIGYGGSTGFQYPG